MAEILIQRKRHRNVWPWLLGLLALALLPLPFLGTHRTDARLRPERTARRAAPMGRDTAARRETAAAPAAVAARPADTARGSTRTTATAAGAVASRPGARSPATTAPPRPSATGPAAPANEFERFIATRDRNPDDRRNRDFTADALRRLAAELRAVGASEAGARTVRAYADSLQTTGARSRAHPDQVRAAFLAAVRELDVLRARYRAPVDTGRLRSAAWAIQPEERLLAQRERVQSFLEAAADGLRSLAGRRSGRVR